MVPEQFLHAQNVAMDRGVMATFLGDRAAKAVRLTRRYSLDWVMLSRQDGSIQAWAECKRIGLPMDAVQAVLVTIKKWQEGCELARLGGKPFLIVAELAEGVFYVRHDEVVGASLLTDSCAELDEDIEPCVSIPLRLFRRLNPGANPFVRSPQSDGMTFLPA